jgi:hypothetical protein
LQPGKFSRRSVAHRPGPVTPPTRRAPSAGSHPTAERGAGAILASARSVGVNGDPRGGSYGRRSRPALPVGCRRSERWSEIPSRFRVISRVCEEENFPPLQRGHPKRSLPPTGLDPIGRQASLRDWPAAPRPREDFGRRG